MKKEFVMSLSQSYRQDLLDAIQLAEQGMQYAFQLNKSHKKKKPGKQKLVGQKADLLFFHPTKECLQFLYVTVIEVLQSVKDIDTVGFIPGTGKEFLRGYAEVFTDAQKFVH